LPHCAFTLFPPADARARWSVSAATYAGGQSRLVKVCFGGLPGLVFQLGQAGPTIESITTRSASSGCRPVSPRPGVGTKRHAFPPAPTSSRWCSSHALYTLFGFDAATAGIWPRRRI
jgi:hypothetical protein